MKLDFRSCVCGTDILEYNRTEYGPCTTKLCGQPALQARLERIAANPLTRITRKV